MKKNVSDQLVEILVNAGIQRIYAVTGDSLNLSLQRFPQKNLEQVIFRKQTQSDFLVKRIAPQVFFLSFDF